YYRLRSQYFELLEDGRKAAEERQHAQAAAPTALDHFLQGEEYRTEALRPAEPPAERPVGQPNRDLLGRAVEQYRQALDRDPKHYWSRLQLGRCCLSLGQESEAVEVLGACVALRPESPWAYSARGLAQARRKRFGEAEADLKRALGLRDDFRPARLNLGYVHWKQGRTEE